MGPTQMLIGGKWTDALADGRTIAVENPARRGSLIASVPRGGPLDVDYAVQAAAAAYPSWRSRPARERGRALLKIADALEAHQEELAQSTALETGNALRPQARPEAALTAELFRYFGGIAGETKGTVLPLGDGLLSYTRREPLGVVGAIIPWNSPLMIVGMKVPAALAAGNTVVLKAAEDAPLTVLRLAELASEHLPPGVLNVVTGYGPEAGAALTAHVGVDKLSFTGSTEVGRAVMGVAAERILPVSLELGGKNPSIVFPDSDDDSTVEQVISAVRFTRQGQSCTSGSRLFLHESIHDSFVDKLVKRLQQMVVGDPSDEATDMGAIINATQFGSVCGYIEDGISTSGAALALGGLPPTDGALAAGYFVQPTVFTGVRNDFRIAREEIFGPVLVVVPWRDEADVVAMANDTHYGLAGFVFCRDAGAALRTAHALDAGWVQVNRGGAQIPGQPYGGYKMSGLGREASLEGMLDSFTQIKSVTVDLEV
jgi:aldehyde dehydrogenase (NAD+)